jgi:hypothetical protein
MICAMIFQRCIAIVIVVTYMAVVGPDSGLMVSVAWLWLPNC